MSKFRLRQQSSAVLPDYFAVSYDDSMSHSCRLGNLIEEHLRPDVVRIDTEGFYPEAFLHRFGAAGGFALQINILCKYLLVRETRGGPQQRPLPP